jgi:tetratricopeptide (TPR) repeat protein
VNDFQALLLKFRHGEFTTYEAFCWTAIARCHAALGLACKEAQSYLKAAGLLLEGAEASGGRGGAPPVVLQPTMSDIDMPVQCYLLAIRAYLQDGKMRALVPPLYWELAMFLLQFGDYGSAECFLLKCSELSDGSSDALRSLALQKLAWLLIRRGHILRAITHLAAVLRAQKPSAARLETLITLYLLHLTAVFL